MDRHGLIELTSDEVGLWPSPIFFYFEGVEEPGEVAPCLPTFNNYYMIKNLFQLYEHKILMEDGGGREAAPSDPAGA